LAGKFKTRKNLKIFISPWKILRGGKTLLKLLFFSIKFSNLEKLIFGNFAGNFKIKKIILEIIFGGNILKLENI
jgi:hypothetical protein